MEDIGCFGCGGMLNIVLEGLFSFWILIYKGSEEVFVLFMNFLYLRGFYMLILVIIFFEDLMFF